MAFCAHKARRLFEKAGFSVKAYILGDFVKEFSCQKPEMVDHEFLLKVIESTKTRPIWVLSLKK
jgi:hypothetical protein